jgi:hypothetical protein
MVPPCDRQKVSRRPILQAVATISGAYQNLVVNKDGLDARQRFGRDSFGNRSKRQRVAAGARKVLQYDTDRRQSTLGG